MNIHTLIKTTTHGKKRLGQGHGSGKVKTAGRGTKGQKARHNLGMTKYFYSGGSLAFVKQLPFLRGKGRNFSFNPEAVVIPLDKLNVFAKGATVDAKALLEKKLIKKSELTLPIKILNKGELTISLTVHLPVSASVKEKIEKIGGKVA